MTASETTFSFGAVQIDTPILKSTAAASHQPKKKKPNQPNRGKMVQNKMTEVTGFHRSFKVSVALSKSFVTHSTVVSMSCIPMDFTMLYINTSVAVLHLMTGNLTMWFEDTCLCSQWRNDFKQ